MNLFFPLLEKREESTGSLHVKWTTSTKRRKQDTPRMEPIVVSFSTMEESLATTSRDVHASAFAIGVSSLIQDFGCYYYEWCSMVDG